MLVSKTFAFFFACVFIIATKDVKDCWAVSPCTPRSLQSTVSEVISENSKICVCTHESYGKICRFKAPDSIALNLSAKWNSNGLFHVGWKAPGENEAVVRYKLTFRKVFNNSKNYPMFGKWRKLTISDKWPKEKIEIHTLSIPLGTDTYEVMLTTFYSSGSKKATSVFLEPPKPHKLTELFQEKDSSCFRNGILVGSGGGALASLVLLCFLIVIFKSLRQVLDKETLECSSLRHQVDDLKKEKSSTQETHQASILALSSENDLLKHQLKKYVAAVQSLRRNEPLDIAVPGPLPHVDFPVLPERGQDENASKDVEIDFERKLIQMADMHGELIELNERLQKMLNIREHQLRGLREELINLRGPLPDDVSRDESRSLDEFGPRLVQVNTRPLINIWIPSAFAQGKSSNIHHIYQVYIRIKDVEWNIYRRYSHFHEMHKKVLKQYSSVSNFKFPQKKVIGNRDAKFVETRRRQLQSYLRKLINYSLNIITELSENPSKSLLLKYFPFFGNSVDDPATAPGHNAQTLYTGL